MYTVRPRPGLRPQDRRGPRETVNRRIPLRGFPPIIAANPVSTNAIPHFHPFYRVDQVSYRTEWLPDEDIRENRGLDGSEAETHPGAVGWTMLTLFV